jgi:hypothetical protein
MRAADISTDKAQSISASADAEASIGSDYLDMEGITPIVELADRNSDDLDVALFWARRSGRFWLLVEHRRSGRTTRIKARPANALDVFHHPFAYKRRAA